MSDHSFDQLEHQLAAGAAFNGAPLALRDAVLAATRRELAAARWDRRLGRAAVAILAVGVGMNAALTLPDGDQPDRATRLAGSEAAVVRTAVAVADATDAETGRRYARQLALLGGRSLTARQAAAIDAAIAEHELDSRL